MISSHETSFGISFIFGSIAQLPCLPCFEPSPASLSSHVPSLRLGKHLPNPKQLQSHCWSLFPSPFHGRALSGSSISRFLAAIPHSKYPAQTPPPEQQFWRRIHSRHPWQMPPWAFLAPTPLLIFPESPRIPLFLSTQSPPKVNLPEPVPGANEE